MSFAKRIYLLTRAKWGSVILEILLPSTYRQKSFPSGGNDLSTAHHFHSCTSETRRAACYWRLSDNSDWTESGFGMGGDDFFQMESIHLVIQPVPK